MLKNETKGGLKRCGGQGDILSGSVGVLLAWGAEWVKGTYESVLIMSQTDDRVWNG